VVTIPDSAIKIVQTHSVFTETRIEQWLQDIVFTWQWWILVGLLVGP
jgi:hypothetical protein